MGLLIIHPFAYACFITLAIYEILADRSLLTILYTSFLIYSFFMCLMVLGLGKYHCDLITANLTTNEDINKHRYAYLNSKFGGFSNPFESTVWNNISDGLFPSDNVYFTRDELPSATKK